MVVLKAGFYYEVRISKSEVLFFYIPVLTVNLKRS